MKKFLTGLFTFFAFVIFCIAGANAESSSEKRDSFCAGFKEGFQSVKGKYAYVPPCPYPPFIPYNSSARIEGIKAGQRQAGK